jgi:hypothetical protein
MSQTTGDVSLKADVLILCPCVLANEGGGGHCNVNWKTQKEGVMMCRYFQTICLYEVRRAMKKIRLTYLRAENGTWDLPNVIRQQQCCAISK